MSNPLPSFADFLVAWCIVPFDREERTPEQRAEMLTRLKLPALAYDWRQEHKSTFDSEVEAMRAHGIAFHAWWMPRTFNDDTQLILQTIDRHGIKPELWVTGGDEPATSPQEQTERIESNLARLEPLVNAAHERGLQVALYNHGGWFGVPENQIALIERFRAMGRTNVGIIYNFHHGHQDVPRFAELMEKMKPHLLGLNLNGMHRDGDGGGAHKILILGEGYWDLELWKIVAASGWRGPVGILNHVQEDSEKRLRENLAGLRHLQLQFTASAQPA